MDVLLVAAKKDKIDDYTDLLIQAGLQPTVVDLDAFALQNAWEINYEVVPGQNVALVNIGAGFTNIGVLRNGMTSFTRDISIGGNHYTDAIQKEFALSADQAERIKTVRRPARTPRASAASWTASARTLPWKSSAPSTFPSYHRRPGDPPDLALGR